MLSSYLSGDLFTSHSETVAEVPRLQLLLLQFCLMSQSEGVNRGSLRQYFYEAKGLEIGTPFVKARALLNKLKIILIF